MLFLSRWHQHVSLHFHKCENSPLKHKHTKPRPLIKETKATRFLTEKFAKGVISQAKTKNTFCEWENKLFLTRWPWPWIVRLSNISERWHTMMEYPKIASWNHFELNLDFYMRLRYKVNEVLLLAFLLRVCYASSESVMVNHTAHNNCELWILIFTFTGLFRSPWSVKDTDGQPGCSWSVQPISYLLLPTLSA